MKLATQLKTQLVNLNQQTHLGPVMHYILSVVIVAVAMGLRLAAEAWVGTGLPAYITFYPAMMVMVVMTSFGPSVLTTALMALIAGYWILPPVGQFAIASPVNRLGLAIFTGTNLCMCIFAEIYRRNRKKTAIYERENALRESQDILRRQVELIDPVRAEIIAREMQRVLRERVVASPVVAVKPTSGNIQHIVTISGVIVAGVGLLVLAGWVFESERITRVLPGLAMMKANTAFCFLLAGLALLFHDKHLARLACAWLICLISGLTLAEYIGGGDFGIDQFLFLDVPDQHALYPGRMSAVTAIGFLLSSLSLLLPKTRVHPALQAQAVGVVAIGTVAILGYLYDMQQLYRFAGFSSVALHTATSFVILGIGLLFARTDGLCAVMMSSGSGSRLLRWLLPTVLLLPPLLGWLFLTGFRHEFYGDGISIALFVITMMVFLSFIVCWSTIKLNSGEAARGETEMQLRNLTEVMNHAHEPLIVRELDGTIRAWNHGAELLYGWSAADALGQHKQALLHTAGHTIEEFNRLLESEGRWEGELMQTTRDGRMISVESRQTASRTSDGQVLILESNLDITSRKKNEEALKESEERLALTASATQVGMFDLNLNNNKVLWSPAHDAIFGYGPVTAITTTSTTTEYDQQRWAERVHPEDLSLVEHEGHRCMQERKPIELQYRIIWPDGSLHWVETKAVYLFDREGKANRMLGVVMDITERKRTEEEARQLHMIIAQEKDRLSALVSSITDEIWFADSTGKFILVNPSGSREFELTTGGAFDVREFAASLEVLETDGSPRPIEESPSLRALRGEIVRNQEELIRTPATGELRHRQVNSAPVRDSMDNIIGSVSVVRDITERKLAEQLIKASLAEKEVMLKEIHHRVKNNLQVISSLVSLQSDNLTDDRMRDELNDVRDRVRSMALIHEKLYQTSNLAQLNFADYAVSLLRSLWRSHGTLAEKTRLNLALAPVALSIEAAVPCGLILNELAGNALKHAFPNDNGGEVMVELEHDPATGTVCLRVRDNGVGLPSDLNWQQSKSLGLRLVRILAGQLRGTVETGSGPGSEFLITFPLNGVQS